MRPQAHRRRGSEPGPLVKRLQLTIFWEVLRVFLLVLTGLTVLLVFVGVFRQATELGLGPAQLLRIAPLVVPSMLPFTIPATLLLTVCVVYGRIAGDLELTAAKAAGINPVSLLTPTLLLAAGLSIFSFALTDRVIPWAVGRITQIGVEAVEDIFLKRLRDDRRFSEPSLGIDVTIAGMEGKRLIRPVFRYVKTGRKPVLLEASWAEFKFDRPGQQIIVEMDQLRAEHPDGSRFDTLGRETYTLPLVDQFREPKARDLSIASIVDELGRIAIEEQQRARRRDLLSSVALVTGRFADIARSEESARAGRKRRMKRRNKLRTETSSRYALACSCFFFALLGSPFALLRGQTAFLTSFLYCFVPIVGAYYPLMLGVMSQAKSGNIDPSWSMWLGNAGLLVAAVVALRKLLRN